jgi:glycosyltransferase involved in cell wall biosynthesis
VIPARNEGRRIHECLGAVLRQDYPADRYEVIVADGMSDDGTRAIVEGIAAADRRVRLIDNPGRIVPTGMNRAIAAATGQFIVRVDGHTIVQSDYVSRAIETLVRTGAEGAGGAMTPIAEGAFPGAVALATSTPFGVGNSAFHYATEERDSDSVYLGAYPKETFRRFGGYDEELVRNQDDELNYRIRSQGGRIVLNPAIRSSYHPRSTARSLFSQYFQYGWWKVRVMTRVPSMISWRFLAPPIFVLGLATLVIVSFVRPEALALLALLLTAHAVAALWFIRGRTAGFPQGSARLVPWATLIIHLAYGLGLLAALPTLLIKAREHPVGPVQSSR